MGNYYIGIAALLLALTGGMFLLAKTKKEELGSFFNVVSWLIIVVSLLGLICGGIRCAAGKGMNCQQNERKHDNKCGGMEGQCHEKMLSKKMMHGDMAGEENCEAPCTSNKKCGHQEKNKMNCCAQEREIKIVKDSVIIKK